GVGDLSIRAMASVEDADPIPAITAGHWLSPDSFARSRIGTSCEGLSREETPRDAIGFTELRVRNTTDSGSVYRPEAIMSLYPHGAKG
ncbi:MAG: hypothetical protein D084_Lepto4C00458G0001, partial [Leptospirillum sp. Group IV 'UBA BS']